MTVFRPNAIANAFYPGSKDAIKAELQQYLHPDNSAQPPKAMIVPHAGWRYSGACAGKAYSKWYGRGQSIKRVILIGPAHRVGFVGMATSTADYWTTPAGVYPLDSEELFKLCQTQKFVVFLDIAHAEEHCLEVQLPFIMETFPNAKLMPFLVSQGGFEIAQQFLQHYWGDSETVIIISSDLSHYTAPEVCRNFDDETAGLIESKNIGQLNGERACGYQGISALLANLASHNLELERVHLCHSGDAAPGMQSVVGYGAWITRELAPAG